MATRQMTPSRFSLQAWSQPGSREPSQRPALPFPFPSAGVGCAGEAFRSRRRYFPPKSHHRRPLPRDNSYIPDHPFTHPPPTHRYPNVQRQQDNQSQDRWSPLASNGIMSIPLRLLSPQSHLNTSNSVAQTLFPVAVKLNRKESRAWNRSVSCWTKTRVKGMWHHHHHPNSTFNFRCHRTIQSPFIKSCTHPLLRKLRNPFHLRSSLRNQQQHSAQQHPLPFTPHSSVQILSPVLLNVFPPPTIYLSSPLHTSPPNRILTPQPECLNANPTPPGPTLPQNPLPPLHPPHLHPTLTPTHTHTHTVTHTIIRTTPSPPTPTTTLKAPGR